MASLAIRIENLEKTYKKSWRTGETKALKGISLNVREGEAFGFIGPNGAGKSTTIRILMGLMRADHGDVRLFDVPATRPQARRQLGYVPENPYLPDYLTPIEIVTMSLHLHGVKIGNRKAHGYDWLERLGLKDVSNKPVRTFSKGMTQRVAIAQALCIMPRLLVLDEPLSGLDPVGRYDVVELLSEYKRAGGTLFFTSHVLHDVERLADYFGLIHEGVLQAVRDPAELTGEQGRVQVRTFGQQPVPGMREDFSGRWIGEVPRSELWQFLNTLEESGHILQEVRPTLSLEEIFMRAIGKEKSGAS